MFVYMAYISQNKNDEIIIGSPVVTRVLFSDINPIKIQLSRDPFARVKVQECTLRIVILILNNVSIA